MDDGGKVSYKMVPWYEVDERIPGMLSGGGSSTDQGKSKEEEAKKAAMQKEFEAKMKELEALKAQMGV